MLTATRKKPKSPAYKFLEHVWENQGHETGHSWQRLNQSMSSALSLAITSQMRFALDDFERIAADFRIGYWGGNDGHMLGEHFYKLACDGTHGPNMSACLSFEKWKDRKPFLVLRSEREDIKVRVHVGARFEWPDWKAKAMLTVHCTSISQDGKSFTAVQRESFQTESGYWQERLKRRFTIDHEKIAEYHAKVRERRKERAEAT